VIVSGRGVSEFMQLRPLSAVAATI